MANELELERQQEQQDACRALLLRPLLGKAESPEAFRLLRKQSEHQRRKGRRAFRIERFRRRRLFPSPAAVAARCEQAGDRALRVEARDRWTPFSSRHYVFLYPILSLLEGHSLVQLPLTELADAVAQLAVEVGTSTTSTSARSGGCS
jgi:hypothetical protein